VADFKEVQKMNADRIVSQFIAVRLELKNKVEDTELNHIAATLTAALWSSDEGAKVNGLTNGKPTYLTPSRG